MNTKPSFINSPIVNVRFLSQPITGTQRYAIELCRCLKNILPQIRFVAPDNIIHKDIAKELDVQIIGRFKTGILWEQLELPLYLKRIGEPLLINLSNLAPIYYKNKLVTIHDLSFYLHPEWFSTKFVALHNAVVPKIARNAQRIITVSESSRKDIIKTFGINPDLISIVHPAVSKIFMNRQPLSSENKYGEYILSVSSKDPRKNFRGLIKAFKDGDFGLTKLLIVGSEDKAFANDDLKALVNNDPRIVFTGFVDDNELVELYRHAIFFAYTSFFEGFGIPPLEAMACGCPTLVSNTTSLPEVCGDASVYVDPYDIDSIRGGLITMLNDGELRADLIRKGYERLTNFDWQRSAQKLADIVKELTL